VNLSVIHLECWQKHTFCTIAYGQDMKKQLHPKKLSTNLIFKRTLTANDLPKCKFWKLYLTKICFFHYIACQRCRMNKMQTLWSFSLNLYFTINYQFKVYFWPAVIKRPTHLDPGIFDLSWWDFFLAGREKVEKFGIFKGKFTGQSFWAKIWTLKTDWHPLKTASPVKFLNALLASIAGGSTFCKYNTIFNEFTL